MTGPYADPEGSHGGSNVDTDPEHDEPVGEEGEEEWTPETPLEELLDQVANNEGNPQAFLVIRDLERGINGAWKLRPEAGRVLLTYLMRNL